MATTTATITINSSDLTGDPLSLSTTATLYKAGQTVGLENTSGVGRTKVTSTSQVTLYDGDAYANGSHKVYLANKSTDATEYFTIEMNSEQIGKLYAGDWMFIPWEANADTNDLKDAASVSTGMVLEHMIISE
jgi:DNA repair protein RadC